MFFDAYRNVMRPFLREASVSCDTDLIALLFDGGIDALPDGTKQFFTYAFSAGAAAVAKKQYLPSAAAGYSFGIYAALHAAEVLSFEDGLFLLDQADKLMSAASEGHSFGMGIIVGLGPKDIAVLLESGEFETVLETNCNHDHCHVFSGEASELDAFLKAAEADGAFKFERLDVQIPYHHPALLAEVPEAFRAHCDGLKWHRPLFPVISTIDGSALTDPDAILDYTARHPATPIRWTAALKTFYLRKVETLFECGPGISLTQNGRFVPYETTYINAKKVGMWGSL